MMWFFKEEREHLKLVSGSSVFTVLKLERDDAEKMIKVYAVDEEEPHLFNLEEFDGDKSAFGSKLKQATHSRGLFVKLYDHCREERLQISGESKEKQRKTLEKTNDTKKGESQTTKESRTTKGSPKKQKKTDEASHKKMKVKKTTKSQYDNNLKIVGDCVDVHITNLTEPPRKRLVRTVDPEHVQMLTEEFRRSSTMFVMLAGLIHDEDVTMETLKEPDCGIEVETIGGNHTRIALQYLLAAGHLGSETVKVRVYHELTNDEALEVGYMHNKKAELSKKMTFMDKARLIKDKLQNCPAERVLEEKKKLAKIFDKSSVTKLNHDYKAHLALGSKANDEIWDLAMQIENRWREGQIKGGKKGKEVKQTIFKNLYSYNLRDADRVELLSLVVTAGTKAFSKRLMALVDKNDKEDNEDMEETGNRQAAGVLETMDIGNETENEIHTEEPAPEEEIVDDDLSQTEKDEMIEQLKSENEKLKRENEELKRVVAELEARTTDKRGEKRGTTRINHQEKKSKALQNEERLQISGESKEKQRKTLEKTNDTKKGESQTTKESRTTKGSPKKQKKTDEASHKKMKVKKTTKSQYDNNLKIVGDCVDVHITNLTEPPRKRLVRTVDPEHVQMLTEEFRRSSTMFVMLAGLIHDEDVTMETLKEPDCGIEVETIGGNHTRIALQYLLAAGHLGSETVKVRVYHELTNDEALEVGYMHNKKAELSKKMTFMDKARLIKDKLQNCPAERVLEEKKKLAKIFDKSSVTKLNHDYKAHLALGSKANDEIWDLAMQIENRWREGQIKGGKKGKEVKQTIFKNLYSYNLRDADRVELLSLVVTAGTKAFSKRLMALVDKNDKEDNEDMEETGNRQAAGVLETMDIGNETENEIHTEEPAPEEEIVDDDLSQTEKDEMIEQLKSENEKLKRENEELKRVVAELEARTTDKRGEKRGTTRINHQEKKSKALQNATGNENKAPSRKRNTTAMVDSFSVGDEVNAVWSKDNQKYKARITNKHSDDLYTVKFYDDYVEDRARSQLELRSKVRKK